MITLLPKQEQLLSTIADKILYGGARGGAKTFGSVCAAALEVVEKYREVDIIKFNIDKRSFRIKQDPDTGKVVYYKFLIDYSYYMGVIVRRGRPQLQANTLVECRKVYPLLGGIFDKAEYCWNFPSGASIYLRPLQDEETLNYFQGPSFQRFIVEELTQFDKDEIEQAQCCCRSAEPIGGGQRINAKMIFTTNPGGKGHKWVKEYFVDRCPPLKDGPQLHLSRYNLWYQPLKANNPYVTDTGERILFIPSLVFDNPHLVNHDERYVKTMLGLNSTLLSMWVHGNWDIFPGQYFHMWRDDIHVIPEYEFYGAKYSYEPLSAYRKNFKWKEKGYRLFMSNDYGFSEKSAWACGMYAVDNKGFVVKFAEIVESGMSISQQAEYTITFLKEHYSLDINDFEIVVADPNSYWQRRDQGSTFYTFADVYATYGICLVKGKNDRIQGAGAMVDYLSFDEKTTVPKLRFLSNSYRSISSIPNLMSSKGKPNDVEQGGDNHSYDETRYFVMMLLGEIDNNNLDKKQQRRMWDLINKKQEYAEEHTARRYLAG